MLSRATIRQSRTRLVRGFASAQALRLRIHAIKNIKKITTAMKVVATVKLRSAQEALMVARFFQKPLATVVQPAPNAKFPPVKKQLWVGMSSDRGLCGGINSTIARGIRDSILASSSDIPDKGIVLYGEKARAALNTQFGHLFRVALSDCDRGKPVTFYACGELADYWLAEKADRSLFFFQKFKSMIAYATTIEEHYSYEFFKDNLESALALYEPEGPDDMMRNLLEYTAAVKLFYYFAENNASTLSARMQAMGNSSTSANEMLASLTLYLNRSRQAKITTELSEIVGGAAAIDDEEDGEDAADVIPNLANPFEDQFSKEELAACRKEEEEADAAEQKAIDDVEAMLAAGIDPPEYEHPEESEEEEDDEIMAALKESDTEEGEAVSSDDDIWNGPAYTTDEQLDDQEAEFKEAWAVMSPEEREQAKKEILEQWPGNKRVQSWVE